jgi:chromosomal replication initiation ATPase DnaA
MSTTELNPTNSIYELMDLIPADKQSTALSIILPHLNYKSRQICIRIHNKLQSVNLDEEHTFKVICDLVSAHTGVLDIANTHTRKKKEVLSRYMVMFFMREEFVNEGLMSLQYLGRLFKTCIAHSIVIYATSQIQNLYATDKDIRDIMNDIAQSLADLGYTRPITKLKNIKTYAKRQSI